MTATAISRKAINQQQRTVEVAFSSDQPIEDFPGLFHILEHTDDAVDLARLNDGAPVLVNHTPSDHVGVVERAWIGDDRKGRALLRFGKSARADEIWQDVVDGIRPHISVGADLTGEVVRDEKLSDKDKTVFRVLGWTPREISFASVAADPHAGVGRNRKEHTMPPDNEQHRPSESERELERQKASKSTAERINEIYAIGEEFGVQTLAREYATNGRYSDDDLVKLKRAAADAYFERKKKELEDLEKGDGGESVSALGLSNKEARRFSVTRALNALLENNWKGAEFERECSDQIADQLDRAARGVYIPHEVQMRAYDRAARVERAMTTTGTGTGAEFVGVQHSPENFIEQLRNNVVAIQAGARLLPGLRQTLDIPRKTAGATFAWLAESGTVTLSDLGTGNLTLTPKTVGGGVQASRRMMKQSLPAIDDLIMMDLAEGASEIIDLGIIQGSGASNQPTGVINTSGINTQIVNPNDTPTWAEVVGFRTAVAVDNALRGSLAWVTTSTFVGNAMTIEKATNTGRFLMEESRADTMFGRGNGVLLGYPVFESNALTAGTVVFGNWAEVLVGMWGVLDLRPDPYTAANQDALIIRAFQDIDVGVRHAVSFCKNVLV